MLISLLSALGASGRYCGDAGLVIEDRAAPLDDCGMFEFFTSEDAVTGFYYITGGKIHHYTYGKSFSQNRFAICLRRDSRERSKFSQVNGDYRVTVNGETQEGHVIADAVLVTILFDWALPFMDGRLTRALHQQKVHDDDPEQASLLGFLGLFGTLGSTLDSPSLYGQYALFSLVGLFGYKERSGQGS